MAGMNNRVNDLTDLVGSVELTSESLINHLTSTSNQSNHFFIGDKILLSLNQSKPNQDEEEEVLTGIEYEQTYYGGLTTTTTGTTTPSNNLFEFINRIYFLMRRSGLTQSIIFRLVPLTSNPLLIR